MTLNLDDLERVAKAATPGDWRVRTNRHTTTSGEEWGWVSHMTTQNISLPGMSISWEAPTGRANAAHIATFNPKTALYLISRARDAERLEAEKSEWARIQIGNGMEIGRHIATLVALQRAARHLLDACYAADAAEELSMEIDGSLLDTLKAFVPDDPEAWGKLSALNEGGPANG